MDKTRVYLTESLSSKVKQEKKKAGLLATIIMIIGFLVIISGFFIGGYLIFADTGFLKILIACVSGLIVGVLIIGFGKIIKLLQEIINNIKQ